jgi:SAM-dependent methyltransferase
MLYSRAMRTDLFRLYEASVQDVDFDLYFFRSVYRTIRGTTFERLREDFCGTARLACTFVQRKASREAWAVDLDARTLAWTRAHHLPLLGDAARRIHLVRADVRRVRTPKVDVVTALNCSWWVFKKRPALIEYFRSVHRSLAPRGLMVLDAFGGDRTLRETNERRRVRGIRTFAGERVPPFTYIWEQKSFNPVDYNMHAAIHFELDNGRKARNAFTYDWRVWSLPEMDEALREAGFKDVHVYVQGWDDDRNRALDLYRRRTRFENQESWLALIIGVK